MKIIAIHRLLSFLLACVLLAQTAVGVAGWHIDFPPATPDHQSAHCAVIEQHHATHHAGEQDTVGEHHHQCCHTPAGNVAVPVNTLFVPQVEMAALIPLFSTDPYRNPLADLLIRPPIA
ncbi:hypothetical protein [Thiothrix fructosivorans]|uniref:DUF2946 domain-containing protein n=1 Tax=Thiothrix fructosivorans TaxID=111770 RepID=A0A8B0SPY8_9GAMM|nr:hypothetical protein [Thiothrix fructosivorans]MBO0611362.1 hypothetical protein [Thiothrix fructosivorans]QTX13101.1 hypothetical protein J1836_021000 [Thiothrix fructosivorans]